MKDFEEVLKLADKKIDLLKNRLENISKKNEEYESITDSFRSMMEKVRKMKILLIIIIVIFIIILLGIIKSRIILGMIFIGYSIFYYFYILREFMGFQPNTSPEGVPRQSRSPTQGLV